MSLKIVATVFKTNRRSVGRSVKLLAEDCRVCKKSTWDTESLHSIWRRHLVSVTRQSNNVRFKKFLELKMVRGCESTWEVPYTFARFLLISRCQLLALVDERVLGQMNPDTAAFMFLAGLIKVSIHKQTCQIEVVVNAHRCVLQALL